MKKKCFEAKYIFPIIICSVLTFFVLWDVGWSIGLHALMKGYDLPEEAEILLRPKIRHICCVDGNRTNIEMVYRMPEEYIDQVEFGYQAKKGLNWDFYFLFARVTSCEPFFARVTPKIAP